MYKRQKTTRTTKGITRETHTNRGRELIRNDEGDDGRNLNKNSEKLIKKIDSLNKKTEETNKNIESLRNVFKGELNKKT